MDLSAVRRASILLLNIYEILLPATQLLLPLHPVVNGSSFSFEQSSGTPGFLVFFYSGSPSILPASFISFMDSLQHSNYHPLLSFFRSSLPSLPRQHFLVSALPMLNPFLGSSHCHYHRIAHPSSSLKVRCITPFSFLNYSSFICKSGRCVSTPLSHSGRSYTPTHSIISVRFWSKSFKSSSFIWFLSLLPSPEFDHCVTSPDGCPAKFESSHLRFYQSPFR
ncbi:hypothetical protein AMECASPLE_014561 [Ameca splendens]|uniref:Uncharacterized protein n=1 Tax=Ameca splendens TaxID=208324 RepID=A0ABV1A7Y9_9TELE